MAHHSLGHTSEARAWLAKAEEQIDQAFALPSQEGVGRGLAWNQRLDLSLLRREAKTLIQAGHPLYLPANVFMEHQGTAQIPVESRSDAVV